MMAPYITWHVTDAEQYKLVLRASDIIDLEEKLGGGNLLGHLGSQQTGLPRLGTMLTVTHASAQRYQHGTTMKDVVSAFDRYVEAGGDQITFFTDVYTKIFEVSGFFTSRADTTGDDKIQGEE